MFLNALNSMQPSVEPNLKHFNVMLKVQTIALTQFAADIFKANTINTRQYSIFYINILHDPEPFLN